MAAPDQSTCSPWATIADLCSPCDDYDFNATLLSDALQVASDILYDMTGRRWPGSCQETVRPCSRYSSIGHWCGCNRPRSCGCSRLSEIKLPGNPVTAINSVKIDGTVVPAEQFRVDDNRWLVYLPADDDERQGWPCCQDLTEADSAEDTFSVTYTYGVEPPLGGTMAAAALACELALSCSPETVGACRLPKRVTTITRQGITLAVLDPLTLFADGLTGLPEVDLWVSSVNRGTKTRRASVMIPGAGRAIRRAGT